MIQAGTDDVTVRGQSGQASGADLQRLVRKIVEFRGVISRLCKRMGSATDERVVSAFVKAGHLTTESLIDPDALAESIGNVGAWLHDHIPAMGNPKFHISEASEHDGQQIAAAIHVKTRQAGVTRTTVIGARMLSGSDYRLLLARMEDVKAALGSGPYTVQRGEVKQQIDDFENILDRILNLAARACS